MKTRTPLPFAEFWGLSIGFVVLLMTLVLSIALRHSANGTVIGGIFLSSLLLGWATFRHSRMRRAVESSESNLRGIVESVIDGIITIDREGLIRSWNQAASRMFGYSPGEVLGRNISLIMPTEYARMHDSYLQNFLKTGEAKIIGIGREVIGKRKDETTFPLDLSISESHGPERIFTGVVRDITERKRAEAELRESEQRFRVLFEMAALGMAQVGLDGRFVRVNLKFAHMLGYSADEMIGRTSKELTDPHDLAIVDADVQDLIKGNIPSSTIDKRYIHKDGHRIWVSLTLSLVRNDSEQPLYFIAAVQDISDRKVAESELRKLTAELEQRVVERTSSLALEIMERRKTQGMLEQKEAQMRLITDALPAGVIYIDKNLIYRFCNAVYASWIGRLRSEIVGCHVRDIRNGSLNAVLKALLAKVLDGDGDRYDMTLDHQGQKRRLHVEAVPDNAGVFTQGCVILLTDISERAAIEAEMAEARAAADAASQAKSMFVATMSHEIRTPIGVILGFADRLLREEVLPLDRVRLAETIQRNGHNLLAIVNDILDLSKVEQGKLEIERSAIELPIFLDDVIAQMRLKAEEKGLLVSWSNRGPIPEIIQSDKVRLRQILYNLIGNAIKFTSSGSVDIVVGLTKNNSRRQVQFIVTDTGIGVSLEHQAKIFSPFTQADPSISRKFGGTGLGLSLSRQLAVLLGGDLELLASAVGKGSTFCITIDVGPVEKLSLISEQEIKDLQVQHEEVRRLNRTVKVSLDGYRILLAEDFEDNQELIGSFLKESGASVDIAEDGSQAIEMALAHSYDVILMDLQMPKINGYEASATLRARGIGIPIIALTAHAMRGEMEKCLEAGCTDFLSKPIERLDLLKAVQTHIRAHETREPQARTVIGTEDEVEPLFSRLEGNPAFEQALQKFVRKLPAYIEQLRHLYAGNDQAAIRRLAHQLRGAGGGYGFPDITRYSEIIELMPQLDTRLADSIEMLGLICNRVAAAYGNSLLDVPSSHLERSDEC